MAQEIDGTAVLRIVFTSLLMTTLAACGGDDDTQSAAQATPATAAPALSSTASSATAPATAVATPKVVSFTSSATQVSAGENVTLSWEVQGAEKVEIRPGLGQFKSNKTTTAPTETTTYELVATTGDQTDTETVVVSILPTASNWQTTETPPALVNPRIVDVAKVTPQWMVAFGLHCAGLFRQVKLGDSEDALIYMSGDAPLRYPLHVTGGRNVRVVGVHIELETQTGCGIGQLPNWVNGSSTETIPNANIHPRVPGGIAMRLQQSMTTFVEGVYLDLRGHETDCFVSRNTTGVTGTVAKAQRDFIVQNTYCAGIEGLGQSKVGDGVHGDLWQNQGAGSNESLRRLVFENVSALTSMEGTILLQSANGMHGAAELVLRRLNYTWDRRYTGDDLYEQFGLALAGFAEKWLFDDVWIDDFRDGGDYILLNNQRYGVSTATNVSPHPEIFSGTPPAGDFALPQNTGVNYVSPHGGVPTI